MSDGEHRERLLVGGYAESCSGGILVESGEWMPVETECATLQDHLCQRQPEVDAAVEVGLGVGRIVGGAQQDQRTRGRRPRRVAPVEGGGQSVERFIAAQTDHKPYRLHASPRGRPPSGVEDLGDLVDRDGGLGVVAASAPALTDQFMHRANGTGAQRDWSSVRGSGLPRRD